MTWAAPCLARPATWRAEAGVEVLGHRPALGQWIDARKAHYSSGKLTPMQYGLGAQAEAGPCTLDFGAPGTYPQVEQTFNIHGGNLDHPNAAPAQAPIGQHLTTVTMMMQHLWLTA